MFSMDALVRFYGIESASITIALDGESALQESESGWPLRIDQKCVEYYLLVVQSLLKQLPVEVTFRWVEGHQKEKGFNLDWWAAKNDLVDTNEYLSETMSLPQSSSLQANLPSST